MNTIENIKNEKSWEKRFDEKFISGFHWRQIEGQDIKVEVKSFISTQIQQAREEVLREIMYHKDRPIRLSHQRLEKQSLYDSVEGYNKAIDKFENIINKALQKWGIKL